MLLLAFSVLFGCVRAIVRLDFTNYFISNSYKTVLLDS